MRVYIVLEHPDGGGGTASDMADVVHGVFLERRWAEEFVRGMVSYIRPYEGERLIFEDGKIKNEGYAIHFQVVEKVVI